jgi:hypothetical protein
MNQTDQSRLPVSTAHRPTVKGEAFVMFAFDLGLNIDLEAAARMLRDSAQRKAVRRPGRAPAPDWFEYEPAPLRVVRESAPLEIRGRRTEPVVECTIYDFGAVSVVYRMPIEGALDDLIVLAASLDKDTTFRAQARSLAEQLSADIAGAIGKPSISSLVEDYAVFALREWTMPEGWTLDDVVIANAMPLTQVLQGDETPLSAGLSADLLRSRLSYTPQDAAIIEWNAAVLFDHEPDDVLVLLEHANVELLEMRVLDAQLDGLLERAGALLSAQGRRMYWPLGPSARDLQVLAELQTDSSLMFEGVNNALKLFGDQYLARVYRVAAERMHLPDWDAAVLRKLATAESIHDKIAGFLSAKRMEVLEVVIVLLIAVSIVLPLFGIK